MSDSRPFPSTSMTKGIALAQLAAVAQVDFSLTGDPDPKAEDHYQHFTHKQYQPFKNYSAWGNRKAADFNGFFSDTNSKVVRIWADWNAIQNTGRRYDPYCLGALDRNIYDAKKDGRTVILTARGFPGWVSGFGSPTGQIIDGQEVFLPMVEKTNNDFPDEADFANATNFPDPSRLAAAQAVYAIARADYDKGGGKIQLRWPGIHRADSSSKETMSAGNYAQARFDLLLPGSDWGTWIQFLAQRYHPDKTKRQGLPTGNGTPPALFPDDLCHIDLLEVVNEPNLENWPQTATLKNKYPIAAINTAQAIRTARAVEATVNTGVTAANVLYFGGPACSDYQKANKRQLSNYFTFLDTLAVKLRQDIIDAGASGVPFPGKHFVFTHHSYIDVEDEHQTPAHANQKIPPARTNSVSWAIRWMSGDQVHFKVRTNPKAPPSEKPKYKTVPFEWKGWPDGNNASKLALTEGGARLGHTGYSLAREKLKKKPIRMDVTRATQGQKITDAAAYFKRSSITKGRVVLITNFLGWSPPAPNNAGNDSSLTADSPTYQNGGPQYADPFTREVTDAMGNKVTVKVYVEQMNDAMAPPSTAELQARQKSGYTAWKKLDPAGPE